MFSKNMKRLQAELKNKQSEAEAIINKEDATEQEINDIMSEVKAIKAKIEAQKAIDEGKNFDEDGDEIKDTKAVNTVVEVVNNKKKGQPFNSFGEQLAAIVNYSKNGVLDNRLMEVQNASGANESIPSEGGFLVQTDFAQELIKNVYDTGILAPMCKKIQISSNSNGVKFNGIDESSRANGSRWGGVQTYWADEAGTVTASKPSFKQIELKLNKLFGLYYATDELLADSSAMQSVISQAFVEEMQFKLDDAIIRGSGAGQPLGILNAACTVSQAKETGQAADTIVYENILKMWSRMIARSRQNAAWLINQECEPQLHSMFMAVGTGGVPVYLPANGLSGSPYATLMGKPVIPIEQAAALGDVGDIILADMSQYILAEKGGMQMASSIHVKFIYDETAFRITYRVDGQPIRDKAITPYKGTSGNTLSSFVTLAARA